MPDLAPAFFMHLYLLRHGPAQDRTTPEGKDSERRLTLAGRAEVNRLAKWMRKVGIKPGLILSSPYARALETAKMVRQELGSDQAIESDGLKPGADYEALVRELRGQQPLANGVILVGHEPDLSEFASLLISGSAEPVLSFKKTGLAKIEIGTLRAGRCGRLCWLVTPGTIGLR